MLAFPFDLPDPHCPDPLLPSCSMTQGLALRIRSTNYLAPGFWLGVASGEQQGAGMLSEKECSDSPAPSVPAGRQ